MSLTLKDGVGKTVQFDNQLLKSGLRSAKPANDDLKRVRLEMKLFQKRKRREDPIFTKENQHPDNTAWL